MGAFVNGIKLGKSVEESVMIGTASAAIVVTRVGCSIAMPSSEELKEFIDECFDDKGKHNEQHTYKKIVSTKNCKYCDFRDKPELCDRMPN